MFGFGTTELILVIGVIVLFFGANKVSELARNVGEAIKYIRGGLTDDIKKDNK